MSLDEFDAFLAQDPDRPSNGPSNLALDQLAAGELDTDAARRLEADLLADPTLANELKRRRLGPAAITDVDTDALLSRIKAGLGEAEAPRQSVWRRLLSGRWLAPGLLVAGAAAAVVVFAVRPPDPTGGLSAPTDGVRRKGQLRLQVIRATAKGSEEMISGARFKPGDTLRFRIDAPGAGAVRIVGIEADGTLYTAWPLPEHAAKARLDGARDDLLLPGSVELDEKVGRETLHLVHCPPAIAPECTTAGPSAAPRCPKGCVSSPFTVQKAP